MSEREKDESMEIEVECAGEKKRRVSMLERKEGRVGENKRRKELGRESNPYKWVSTVPFC